MEDSAKNLRERHEAMKPAAFRYVRPRDVAGAVRALGATPGAKVLAGADAGADAQSAAGAAAVLSRHHADCGGWRRWRKIRTA